MNPDLLSPEVVERLRQYALLLEEANRRARLTGPTDRTAIYEEQILDALPALPFLPSGCRFVDVGTGGGLPGLVWGICRGDVDGVLLDSIGKKSVLVAEIAEKLGCLNIRVINSRSEEYARDHREAFDVGTARAVADARVLAEYLSPLVRVGGRLIAFKGPAVRYEIALPAATWKRIGLSEPRLHPYRHMQKEGVLVVWEKTAPCPKRYPRAPGTAEKTPWCR